MVADQEKRPPSRNLGAALGNLAQVYAGMGRDAEAEQGAIEHMNEDHREAMNLYATRLLGAEPADWRCSGCDPDGFDMQQGLKVLRLEFPARVTGPGDLRKMLVKLAEAARSKA